MALLASAEAYTPTAQRLIDGARERLGSPAEVANALADNLPAPKQSSGKSRRRRRKKKSKGKGQTQPKSGQNGSAPVQPEETPPGEPTPEPAATG